MISCGVESHAGTVSLRYTTGPGYGQAFPGQAWWRHQMETFSALLAICVGSSPVTGEFPSQRPVTRSVDVFLICTWINGGVNIRKAGDLRRHRTHYDVILMRNFVRTIKLVYWISKKILSLFGVNNAWHHKSNICVSHDVWGRSFRIYILPCETALWCCINGQSAL